MCLLLVAPENMSSIRHEYVCCLTEAAMQLCVDRCENGLFCGCLSDNEANLIFQQDANDIGSVALSLLQFKKSLVAILAVANRDAGHYCSDMNPLFLNYLGDVLVRLLSLILLHHSMGLQKRSYFQE